MKSRLADCKIAMFGLGLMGGSLAMALKGKCRSLIGFDPDPDTLELARSWNIVDLAFPNVDRWSAETDLVILAAPICTNLSLLKEIQTLHTGSLMVMDLGSTKARIVQTMAELPERFDPIGGHPMCGKERGSLENADPKIFFGAPFAFTPLPRSSQSIRNLAVEIAQTIGAIPLWMDAETHDRWVASTSHVPFLIANALAAITPEEVKPLIGPGFRSTTRLAPSPWSVMGDILATNKKNILESMRLIINRLQLMQNLIEKDQVDELEKLIGDGSRNYDKFMQ